MADTDDSPKKTGAEIFAELAKSGPLPSSVVAHVTTQRNAVSPVPKSWHQIIERQAGAKLSAELAAQQVALGNPLAISQAAKAISDMINGPDTRGLLAFIDGSHHRKVLDQLLGSLAPLRTALAQIEDLPTFHVAIGDIADRPSTDILFTPTQRKALEGAAADRRALDEGSPKLIQRDVVPRTARLFEYEVHDACDGERLGTVRTQHLPRLGEHVQVYVIDSSDYELRRVVKVVHRHDGVPMLSVAEAEAPDYGDSSANA